MRCGRSSSRPPPCCRLPRPFPPRYARQAPEHCSRKARPRPPADKINGKKVVGHLEQADQFQLLDIQKGWVKIKVTYSDKTSPDSHKGMTGWLNADYVDCYCDAGEYAGEGEANGFVYADENCRNYDEVIELYIRAIQ